MAYKSPIEIIQEEARMHYEDAVVKAIQPYLITVNKDELIKALEYDRAQYDKGYADGRADALNDLVRCKDCKYSVFEQWVDASDIYTCNRTSLTRVCGDCSPTDFCSWGERKDEVEE